MSRLRDPDNASPSRAVSTADAARPDSRDGLVANTGFADAFSLLKGIKAQALHELARQFRFGALRRGDTIRPQNPGGEGHYFLLAGNVQTTLNGVPLARLEAGATFGGLDLFDEPHDISLVTVLDDCRYALLEREHMAGALSRMPRLSLNLARSLCERIRGNDRILTTLANPQWSLPEHSWPEHVWPEQVWPAPGVAARAAGTLIEPLALVRAAPLFADVRDDQFLRRVAGVLQPARVEAGAPIILRGEIGERIYLIGAGAVRVHDTAREFARLSAGHHFGEMSLLDGAPRSADVTALTDCHVFTLPRHQFHAALAQSPEMAATLVRALARRVRQQNRLMAAALSATCEGDRAPGLWSVPWASPQDAMPPRHIMPPRDRSAPPNGETTCPVEPPPSLAPVPYSVHGFTSALAADAERLVRALQVQHAARPAGAITPAAFERLIALARALNARLRSPLAPKSVHTDLSGGLYRTLLEDRAPLPLLIVLASSTARVEIPSFLAVAKTFAAYGFDVTLDLLVVRWENLVDVQDLSLDDRRAAFQACLDGLRFALCGASPHMRMTPVDIVAAPHMHDVVAPEDFLEMFHRVGQLAEPRATANGEWAHPQLTQNLDWITHFYARQQSLRRLGTRQPLLDLAIRAGIGRRAAAMVGATPALLLTSELNQRFLACYQPTLPIANIALDPARAVALPPRLLA